MLGSAVTVDTESSGSGSSEASGSTMLIAIIVPVAVVLLVIIIVIICIVKKKKAEAMYDVNSSDKEEKENVSNESFVPVKEKVAIQEIHEDPYIFSSGTTPDP